MREHPVRLEVASYGGWPGAAGSPPNACGAAGNALGHNPIPIVVPVTACWRPAGASGGYTGGVHRKQELLAIEGVSTGAVPDPKNSRLSGHARPSAGNGPPPCSSPCWFPRSPRRIPSGSRPSTFPVTGKVPVYRTSGPANVVCKGNSARLLRRTYAVKKQRATLGKRLALLKEVPLQQHPGGVSTTRSRATGS